MSYNLEDLVPHIDSNESRIAQLETERGLYVTKWDYDILRDQLAEAMDALSAMTAAMAGFQDYISQINLYMPDIPDPNDIL